MDALKGIFGLGGPRFEAQTFGNALNTFIVGRYEILKDVDANELKRSRAGATELLRKRNFDEARGAAEQLIKKERHNQAEKAIAVMCTTIYARREEFAAGHKMPKDLATATATVFWAGQRLKKKYPGECARARARERVRARVREGGRATAPIDADRAALVSCSLASYAHPPPPFTPQSSKW